MGTPNLWSSKKVKTHKVRPYLVANIIELLDLEDEQEEEEGAMKDVSLEVWITILTHKYDSYFIKETGKCAVVKTSTRQTFFLPVIGLVPQNELTPGDLVGVNKVRFYFDARLFAPILIGRWRHQLFRIHIWFSKNCQLNMTVEWKDLKLMKNQQNSIQILVD